MQQASLQSHQGKRKKKPSPTPRNRVQSSPNRRNLSMVMCDTSFTPIAQSTLAPWRMRNMDQRRTVVSALAGCTFLWIPPTYAHRIAVDRHVKSMLRNVLRTGVSHMASGSLLSHWPSGGHWNESHHSKTKGKTWVERGTSNCPCSIRRPPHLIELLMVTRYHASREAQHKREGREGHEMNP